MTIEQYRDDYPKLDLTPNPFAAPDMQGSYRQEKRCMSCYKSCLHCQHRWWIEWLAPMFTFACIGICVLAAFTHNQIAYIAILCNDGSAKTLTLWQLALLVTAVGAWCGGCMFIAIATLCRICEWLFNMGRC